MSFSPGPRPSYFEETTTEALLIDGPANGQLIQLQGNPPTWEVLLADHSPYKLGSRSAHDPIYPSFRRAVYVRTPLAGGRTQRGGTPSGFVLYVWDGQTR